MILATVLFVVAEAAALMFCMIWIVRLRECVRRLRYIVNSQQAGAEYLSRFVDGAVLKRKPPYPPLGAGKSIIEAQEINSRMWALSMFGRYEEHNPKPINRRKHRKGEL